MGRPLLCHRAAPVERIAALALSALLVPLAPALAQTAPRSPSPAAPASSPALDLHADTRLQVRVTLNVRGETLSACCDALSKAAHIRLEVSPALSGRRVTLFATERPLSDLMAAMADVARLTWRTSTLPTADYQFYQTEAQRLQEQKWIADSEKQAQYYRVAENEAMQAAVRQAVAGRQDGKPSFADVLAAYSPDQIRQAADLAAQPVGVISASDQSHFHAHLIYAAPFADLPPATQASVSALLNHPGYKSAPGTGGHFAPAVADPADMAQSQVGLIAADGILRLGIVPPDGKDVWVSPFDTVSRNGVAGVDDASGAAPELVAALQQGVPIDLRRMPPALRNKRLRFADSVQRTDLSAILESIAAQTGMSIVSDDFLQSDTTPYGWLLGDGMEVTLEEALSQIAKAYGHFITYRDGGLRVRTLTPGLDLRSEPPADTLARLRELTKANRPVRLPEYILMGGMTQAQTNLMGMRQIPGIQQWMPRYNAQRMYGVLHFYALLSSDERRQAESARGCAFRDMTPRQRRAFESIACIGLPERADAAAKFVRSGLYVERRGTRDEAEVVNFHLAADTSPLRVVTYRLAIP